MPNYPFRYAFGDEAGDTGFAFDKGSSRYFVLLLLLLNDPEPLRKRIDLLRQEIGFGSKVEFKFYKTSNTNRRRFLTALKPHAFVGYALVVDKQQLSAEWHKKRDVEFYAACFAELVSNIPEGELDRTILVLDQFGSSTITLREIRRQLKKKFGKGARPFKKISFKRSRSENLIQCADMVASALMREVSQGDSRFFDLVRGKVQSWHKKNLPS